MAIAVALAIVLVDRFELSEKTIITLLDYYGLMIRVFLRLSDRNDLSHLQAQPSSLF